MANSISKQMFIVSASCYKCKKPMRVAMIVGNSAIADGQVYGPEYFTQTEIEIAETNETFIKEHFSGTRQEAYNANTCKNCNSFVGQHYLFANYYCAAIYGDCKYEKIDLQK